MTISSGSAPGRVTTFYSYKGGTGRTMLLANVAWILATAGRRVLVIDWDLEAPGLHHYFAPFLIDPALADTEGLIDMVVEYAAEAVSLSENATLDDILEDRTDTADYKISISWDFPKGGLLDLIPAGRQNASYSTRFNAFDWHHFYTQLGGGVFFDKLRERMTADYDFVLIDSRTGVSDTSGICTVQLPDSVVACFTASEQSMAGVAGIAESIKLQWRSLDLSDDRRVFPVMCRVEQAEKEKLEIARGRARRLFARTLRPLNETEQDFYWSNKQVLYWPWYAYEEVLAVFGDRDSYAGSVLSACEAVADLVSESSVTRLEVAPSPPDRDRVLAAYARKGGKSSFNAIALLAGETWAEAEFVLESLREEVGRRITTIAWPDLKSALDSSPGAPLLVFFGRRPFVDMRPDAAAALRSETSGSRKIIVVRLPGCSPDATIPRELTGCPTIAFDDPERREDTLLALRHLASSGEIIALDDARFVDIRQKQRLATYAADWIKSDRGEDFLLRGAALADIDSWLERTSLALSAAERDFVAASHFAHNQIDLAQRLEGAQRAEAAALARLEVAEDQKRYAQEQRALADQASMLSKEAMIEAKARSDAAGERLKDAAHRDQEVAERERRAEEREKRDDRRTRNVVRYATSITLVITLLSAAVVGRFLWSQKDREAANETLRADAARRQTAATEVPNLIATARAAESSDPTLAVLLLTEAIQRSRAILLSPSADAARELQHVLETIQSIPLVGHKGPITAVDISANGRTIVTASQDGTVRTWSTDGSGTSRGFAPYQKPLVAVSFSATSNLIAAGSDDGTVLLYDRANAQPKRLFPGTSSVRTVGFYADNVLFATYDSGPTLLFDVAANRKIDFAASHSLSEPIFVVAGGPRLSGLPHGGLVVADGNGHVYAATIEQEVLRPKLDGEGEPLLSGVPNITTLVASRDGRLVAAGTSDGRVELSVPDATADVTKRLQFSDLSGIPEHLSVSSGYADSLGKPGRLVVAARTSADNVLIEEVRDQALSKIGDHDQPASLALLSPNADGLLTAEQAAAKLTCITTSTEITLNGIASVVSAAAFDPQSRFLVMAFRDGTARVWFLDSKAGCFSIAKPLDVVGAKDGKASWIDGLLTSARIAAGRNLNADEWCRTFGLEPWHATFPALESEPPRACQ